jgi:hypothetical protein
MRGRSSTTLACGHRASMRQQERLARSSCLSPYWARDTASTRGGAAGVGAGSRAGSLFALVAAELGLTRRRRSQRSNGTKHAVPFAVLFR